MTIRCLPLLLVSALFPTDLAAQASLSVGGGLTMSKVSISSTTGLDLVPDSRTGITAGIRLTRPLSGSVALEVGGAYVQKGYEVSLEPFGGSGSGRLKLDYLELTALAKLISHLGGFQGGDGPSLHLLAGPALGITMSCSASVDGDAEDCDEDTIAAADLGVLVGVGIRMGRFRVDATYTLGISNINTDTDDDADSVKNRSMALQAGIVIPLASGS